MIDPKVIKHIAKLARLKITESEATEYSSQMEKILQSFEKIAKVDTNGIEPLITPTEIEPYWREDVVSQEITSEEILANAPSRIGNLFKVPPVV
ncbi:MAG: Asp-tRNA(Asn)/Glu-tRNA(Gln) amidotransferase subunit GatC [Bacillota bacterium]